MLLIAPIILLAAALVGYWLAGTSLRPVQGIMDELEAITDGRACTGGSRCRYPATRSPGSRSR